MRTLACIIPFILLVSCSSHKTPVYTADTGKDTLLMGKLLYRLDSIGEAEFKTAREQGYQEEENEMIDDTGHVRRDSLKLSFHLTNGADSILINDTTEEGYVIFSYIESSKIINYWLLEVTYYEGREFLLVDRDNGDKIWIWGRPVYSPGNRYFVTYSCDLEAGYDANGFQLFEIRDGKAVLRWSKVLEDWGPWDIRWKNDNTLYIEQMRLDMQHDYTQSFSYRSMTIY